jgi:FtsH-binding integral membrane protein
MRKLLEKYVIVQYILRAFVKTLLIALAGFTVIFAVFQFTGLYGRIETALDLKYNSPFVLIPLWGFVGLAGVCFILGFLMYFHKYKRSGTKSAFHQAVATVFEEK